jgi:hypothetical protein
MMAKVVSLFGSEEDADRALEEVQAAGLAHIDWRVIQRATGVEATDPPNISLYPGPVPAAPNTSGVAGPLPVDFDPGVPDISEDREEQTFFIDGLRKGGVLVIVEASQEEAARVRQIFDEHHGRTSSGS